MFKFTDLSDKDEEFKAKDYLLNSKQFFEKRRTNKKNYIFDLRNEKSFEISHLPGAHNLPFEQFEDSIYQMPFSGEIMLYGTNDIEKIQRQVKEPFWIRKEPRKHRFFYLLGTKGEKKKIVESLKHPLMPYPKDPKMYTPEIEEIVVESKEDFYG